MGGQTGSRNPLRSSRSGQERTWGPNSVVGEGLGESDLQTLDLKVMGLSPFVCLRPHCSLYPRKTVQRLDCFSTFQHEWGHTSAWIAVMNWGLHKGDLSWQSGPHTTHRLQRAWRTTTCPILLFSFLFYHLFSSSFFVWLGPPFFFFLAFFSFVSILFFFYFTLYFLFIICLFFSDFFLILLILIYSLIESFISILSLLPIFHCLVFKILYFWCSHFPVTSILLV